MAMRKLLVALALLATPAHGQSLTLGNLKAPVARICRVTPAATVKILWAQLAACPSIAAPVPTPTPTPTPAPTPAFVETSKVAGTVPDVPSGLDVASLVAPKSATRSNAPDVGAFRFVCGPGQGLADDPIVYPGQPGKSHPHRFFGNLLADASSTYESLRKTGESTCMNALNRSAYWVPELFDGRGNAIVFDNASIYYKQFPASDPNCKLWARACVELPNGLRMIFGHDVNRTGPQPENDARFTFKCLDASDRLVAGPYPDLTEPAKACKPGMQIVATISTGQCWDGTNLDSADHRSHVNDRYATAATDYIKKCDAEHPFLIPQFTAGLTYSVREGDDPTLWTFSCDHMMPPGSPAGACFHADWFGAWEERVRAIWHANCIDRQLDCVDGDLGNGTILTRGAFYPYGKAARVPVPVQP